MQRNTKIQTIFILIPLAALSIGLLIYWSPWTTDKAPSTELTPEQEAKVAVPCEPNPENGSEQTPYYGMDFFRPEKTKTPQDGILPFREIGDSLGRWGESYSSAGDSYGLAVFDANGDGRLDIYMPERGRILTKHVNEEGAAIVDQTMHGRPSTLLLNQGNDAEGNPVFKSVQDLIAEKEDFTCAKKELLIEDKYRPRCHTYSMEEEVAPGRLNISAIAADFNADGRQDLYILNSLYGMSFQSKGLGIPMYPVRDTIAGEDEAEIEDEVYVVTRSKYIIPGEEDGLHSTVHFGDVPEAEGRNTLLLNMGDVDNDGIPEWEDVTLAAGVGGRWDSIGGTVADIDRDGDLDIYVANFGDPDFRGFGIQHFSGNSNQLYINQLVETGTLTFKEKAEEYRVAGLHQEEDLPSYVTYGEGTEPIEVGLQMFQGKQVGETADHTWAAQFVDWNDDGWPDLVVANDVGNRLRVYENKEGTGFERVKLFDDEYWNGCWMGVRGADFDGDLMDELFISSCGSQMFSAQNIPVMYTQSGKEVHNTSMIVILNAPMGKGHPFHALLDFTKDQGLKEITKEVILHHGLIPPDITLKENVIPGLRASWTQYNLTTSLAGAEFAWGPIIFDVENDGDLDIYLAGALNRGNDNLWGDALGSPGRMLVNDGASEELSFSDRTLEYRLLDITHMDYDHEPPRRPSPGTGWHKRDFITIHDLDAISSKGLAISAETKIRDIFRMHEEARGMINADFNNDGYDDLIVRHKGGYDSLSPDTRNLKVKIGPVTRAVPSHNRVLRPPTLFDPGPTFLYINTESASEEASNWIKIKLIDRTSKNRDGIGAKVIVNNRLMRRITLGGTAFSFARNDLIVGLGQDQLKELSIEWPSGEGENVREKWQWEEGISNTLVCIERGVGVVDCGEN